MNWKRFINRTTQKRNEEHEKLFLQAESVLPGHRAEVKATQNILYPEENLFMLASNNNSQTLKNSATF